MTKTVVQLDEDGFYLGTTIANESPLEPGVYLLPAGAVDAPIPELVEGKSVKWVDEWVYEDLPPPEVKEEEPEPVLTYADLRAREYPPMADYLDGIVKSDQAQLDKYVVDCLAVKAKYPKPEV